MILAGKLLRDGDFGGLEDQKGTGSNIFCDSLLGCLALLFNLDDLADFFDASKAERLDGMGVGEELREDVFIRVDRRVGRVVRCFGTLD